jgi:DNA modification methylase
MPSLDWSSKSEQIIPEGKLLTESVFYPHPESQESEFFTNRLVLGDNLRVMNALLPDYKNKIDLIYIDPPFFTNKDYAARVGRGEDSRKPEKWKLAKGYRDGWDNLNSYLDMLYPRLQLMHQLLSPTGSLYLHLDWHANAYARILLDEIFGYKNLRNEIIWTYHGPSPIKSAFNRKHDTILFYSKTDQYTFNVDDVRVPYAANTLETFKSSKKAGFGKVPNLERGKVPEDWWYFPVVARLHNERTGYPTQKPEAMIERIIKASTNAGDIVADFFGGAGTTATVAQRLNRNFISSDNQLRAFYTSRSRLVLGAKNTQAGTPEAEDPGKILQIQREENLPPIVIGDWLDLKLPVLSDGSVTLPDELASQAIYWEIDPDWQGEVFHSRYQEVRPWRKGEIKSSINLDDHKPGSVCVRVLSVSGEQVQALI